MRPRDASISWTRGGGPQLTTVMSSPYYGGAAAALAAPMQHSAAQAHMYPPWALYAAAGVAPPGSPGRGMGPVLRHPWYANGTTSFAQAPFHHMPPPSMEWPPPGGGPLAVAAPGWRIGGQETPSSFPATHAAGARWQGPVQAKALDNPAPQSRKRSPRNIAPTVAMPKEGRSSSSDTAGSDGSDSDYVDPSWKRRRQGAPRAVAGETRETGGTARPPTGAASARRRSSSEAEEQAQIRSRNANYIMSREKALEAAVPDAWIYPARRDSTRGPLSGATPLPHTRAAWEGPGAAPFPANETRADEPGAGASASASEGVGEGEGGHEEGRVASKGLAAHAEGVAPYSKLRGRARHAQRERMRWQYIAALGERLRSLLLQEKREAHARAQEQKGTEESKELLWDNHSFLSQLRVTTPRIHVVESAVDYIRLQMGLRSAPVSPAATPRPTLRNHAARFRQTLQTLGALGRGRDLLAHGVALLVAEDGTVLDGTHGGRELIQALRRQFGGQESPPCGRSAAPADGADNLVAALPGMKSVFARLVHSATKSSAAPLALQLPQGLGPSMLLVSLAPALPAAPTMSAAEGWKAVGARTRQGEATQAPVQPGAGSHAPVAVPRSRSACEGTADTAAAEAATEPGTASPVPGKSPTTASGSLPPDDEQPPYSAAGVFLVVGAPAEGEATP